MELLPVMPVALSSLVWICLILRWEWTISRRWASNSAWLGTPWILNAITCFLFSPWDLTLPMTLTLLPSSQFSFCLASSSTHWTTSILPLSSSTSSVVLVAVLLALITLPTMMTIPTSMPSTWKPSSGAFNISEI